MHEPSPPSGRTFDDICTRFERAWRDGQRPRIEDYLPDAPEPERAALVRELIHLDIYHRGRHGEPATLDEYRARFPGLQLIASTATTDDATPVPVTAPVGLPTLPGYEILSEIARGGMGVVYRAQQVGLKRVVALKMILPGQLVTDEAVQRFREEARNVARLEHENIVPIYEVGESQGQPFFAMKLIDGASLDRRLSAYRSDTRAAARLVALVARAVHHAHQHGIIHRDLKPANVLVDGDGQPHVTDFGLAKRIEASIDQSRSNAIIGTPCYMAPEQAAGRQRLISTVTDVYGLGAILYELLTGRPPFKADSPLDTLVQVLNDEPHRPRSLNPACPRDLEVICLKCLAKEPERRYASALALAEDLERWLSGAAITARPAGAVERVVRWVRRHPTTAALILVSFLASLAGVGVVVANSYNAVLAEKNGQLATALSEEEIAKKEAERQRELARQGEVKARRYYYASQMQRVAEARKANQPDRVVQLLRSVIPENADQEDCRGWEWNHLWRQYQGEQWRLRGHKGAVLAVAFSPDDNLLASGSADQTIKLWNVVTGKEWRTLTGHTNKVTGLAFSPNGRQLASASADGTVRLWDMVTGDEVTKLEGHQGPVTSVTFNADDRHVASGSEDKTVRVWDTTTGREVTKKEFPATVSGVVFSPDGKQIASVVRHDGKKEDAKPYPLIWDPWTSVAICTVGDAGSRNGVAFHPDGRQVAVPVTLSEYGPDGKRQTHTLQTRAVSATAGFISLGTHERPTTHLAYSSDGKRLASCGFDQLLKVWDLTTRKELAVLHDETGIYGVCFSPDSLRVAAAGGDGTIKIWSLPGAALRTLHGKGECYSVAFNPDGTRLAATGGDAVVWDAVTAKPLLRGFEPHLYSRITWSPDGKSLGCGSAGEVWDAETGAVRFALHDRAGKNPTLGGGINSYGVAFSRTRKVIATAGTYYAGGQKTEVSLWDAADGLHQNTFQFNDWAVGVAISPDGNQLVAGSGGDRGTVGTIKAWNLATGRATTWFEEAISLSVWEIAFSPDGSRLAAALGDCEGSADTPSAGEIVVWDTQTGTVAHRLRGHRRPSCVFSIAFSPDGTRLASAAGLWQSNRRFPGEVKIWDLTTGLEVCSLEGGATDYFGVSFSSDGRWLATAGRGRRDGALILWDGTPPPFTPAYQPAPEEPRPENHP